VASEASQDICLLDIEASLEHFAQSKALHADTILIVVEPYLRSLETGRRMIGLARQLSPERIELVVNKLRHPGELESAHELAASTQVEIAAVIPHDPGLMDAERAAMAPLDFDPRGPAVLAIDALAGRLLAMAGDHGSRSSPGLQHPPQ
jgi:CO dehydrogenase maturation factor